MGYVGLPTALAFREVGATILGLDASPNRIAAILRLDVDLIPQDRQRLARVIDDPNFHLTSDPAVIGRADAVIICVPTPVDEHQEPDLSMLRAACATVVENAEPRQTIILTSTSYAGTTRDLLAVPLESRGLIPGIDVYVASSPERIDPGNTRFPHDAVPRVIGGVSAECAAHAAEVLRNVSSQLHLVSSPEAAEMTKLFENTFRAVNIALVNEIADICHAIGLIPAR